MNQTAYSASLFPDFGGISTILGVCMNQTAFITVSELGQDCTGLTPLSNGISEALQDEAK